MKKTLIITGCLLAMLIACTNVFAGNNGNEKGSNGNEKTKTKNGTASKGYEMVVSNANACTEDVCCAYAGPDKTAGACGSGPVTIGVACTVPPCASSSRCPSTFSWSPTTYLSCSNCATPTFYSPCNTPGGNIVYTLTVDGPNCAPTTDQVTVYWPACCTNCCARIGFFDKDKEVSNKDIKMYPNPSSGIITLEFNADFARATVQIYDITGAVVKVLPVHSDSGKALTIDMTGAAKGTYFVQVISNDEGLFNKKLIIE